ncbi:glycosyltransferase family 2 protein [Xanthobacteraceae bacterium Astr-EGSB]|uniref:glycosyltransferase family 2 protein n=1 Tax=Astrobacterium formosum TaxID=3069710 RepID=UPI0027B3BE2F|nr:glycosyltransferase family 2 protein [Xanthobacteraceae bacterium Astr-EGSB]
MNGPDLPKPQVAVLVPAFNEGLTIESVVTEFANCLPQATIYVYDNNSTDHTVEAAKAAGATVRTEKRQGKGNVVRRMFADIDADIYLMVDGDATYDATAAPRLIAELLSGPYDMVNAARVARHDQAYRSGHLLGNRLLTNLVRYTFGNATDDMLSGYKAFSNRYAKSFPAMSRGFEIETELVVHALQLRMPLSEIEAPYKERPVGSMSKLNTYRDGFRILRLIGFLIKEERPMAFFCILSVIMAFLSITVGTPVIIEFLETGLVPRLPTAVLAVSLMLSALLSVSCGFILDSVARGRREIKRLAYLQLRPPCHTPR